MKVSEERNSGSLEVIANLLAMQVIKGLDKTESAWTLKQAGMSNKAIGGILGISNDAVAAHHSNMKKKLSKQNTNNKKVIE